MAKTWTPPSDAVESTQKTEEWTPPSDAVEAPVKKKDVTKTGGVESSSASIFKLPSISGAGTNENAVSGNLPDYSNPKVREQQESLQLKKKMFDTLANKKLNIERKKAIEPELTTLGDKIAAKKKEIDKVNYVSALTRDPQAKQKALEDKAVLEQEHDQMVQGFNKTAEQYNSYNKAVVQDEKLNTALSKQMAIQPAGAKSTGPVEIFGKSIYNATLPALVKALGTTVNVVGELPGMVTGTEIIPEGMKTTDKIGDVLTGWGESLKAEVPDEAKTDIWTDPTPENVASTAGNLIGNLATIIGTGGLGGGVAAGTVGMALGVDESFSAAKSAGLSDKDAAKIALPVGVLNGLLDVVGVDNILKQFERKAITKALSKETIDYLKDKEITQAAAIEAVQFAEKEVIKQAAKGAFKTATTEAATGGIQAANQIAGEEIYDTATGENKFKNTPKGAVIDIAKNALLEGLGGGVAGGVFHANPNTESVYDKVQEINSDKEGMQTFLDELDSHVKAQEITQEQADNIKTKVENLIEADKTIPKEIEDKKQRLEAIELVQEKNKLNAEIETIDPALLGERKKTVKNIEMMLGHIADGTQNDYSYKLDVDTGKYYQIDKEGKEEEITKQAFDIAIKNRKTAVPQAEKEGVKPTTDESNKKSGGEEISPQANAENVSKESGSKEEVLNQPTGAVSTDEEPTIEPVSPVVDKLQTKIAEEQQKENPDLAKIAELQTQLKTEQDAIIQGVVPENDKQKHKGTAEQQQGEQTNREHEKANVPAGEAETGNRHIPEKVGEEQQKVSGITHAQTAETRKEIGMEEYKKEAETQAKWEAEADKEIAKGYNTNKLLSRLERGELPTPIEQKILAKYLSTQKAVVSENPTDENIARLKKAIDISDRAAGTAVGKSLAARAGTQPVNKTKADFFLEQMEASGTDRLTEEQKLQNEKEFTEIHAAQIALEQKVLQLESELSKIKAEQEVKGIRKSPRKTREDFVKERKNIVNDIREKLKKSRGELSSTPLPYAKELVIITPDVIRLMRSYVEEGVTKLSDITKAIHDEFKQDIPDLTEKDVTDIIAGKYSEKKSTRNEIAAKIKDLRDEAALITKLESIQKGEIPKNEKKKVERNKAITELQAKIKEHDLTKLSQAKTRIKSETAKLEKDLAEGNYQKEEKKKLELDKEGLAMKDRLIKARQERQIRLMKDEYANRNKYQKGVDIASEILNTPRALMSSMDFSAPLRQGLVAGVANPKQALGALKTMFEHAVSQKKFDRWYADLKESPEYEVIKKSKLYVADPSDPELSAKEEQFMTNLASKIPFLGTRLVKGSERAYVSYLNKLRVDVFKRYTDELQSQGKTFENSPELYKAMAKYINTTTGRGDLGALEGAAKELALGIFSPRLIASRVNLLTNPVNPKFWATVPKEVKVMYFKDMAKLIGAGMTTLALASLAGADVEDDPRSASFGKMKFKGEKGEPDTTYDIWGGFVQYIRLAAQMLTGQVKNAKGTIEEIDTKNRNEGTVFMRFLRQKLAPVPATATDIISGYDFMGERTDWKKEMLRMLPLTPLDIATAVKDEGVKSLFTVGVPATFGIGVNRYKDKTFVEPNDATIKGVFQIKDYNPKNYRQKTIFIGGKEQEITKEQEEQVNELRNSETEKAVKKVLPSLKKLEAEPFKDAVNIIYNQYEKEAKNKVFGLKWSDEEVSDKTKMEKALENNKVRTILNSIPKFRAQERQEQIRKEKLINKL